MSYNTHFTNKTTLKNLLLSLREEDLIKTNCGIDSFATDEFISVKLYHDNYPFTAHQFSYTQILKVEEDRLLTNEELEFIKQSLLELDRNIFCSYPIIFSNVQKLHN